MPIALIAHGGAGNVREGGEEAAVQGVHEAVARGRAVLRAGGSALDAVCATVVALEDNPNYNAGTGACLNFDGFCELDACVMESRESRVGAVAALQRVKNPILVARTLRKDPVLSQAFEPPTTLDPWLWTGQFDRTYLVYPQTLKRRG